MHNNQIMKVAHRDIKPENILVTQLSDTHIEIKVIDFDIATSDI